jgi:YVTN family beta-propeller protein
MTFKRSLAYLFALSSIASASGPHAYISLCCNQNSSVSVYSRVEGRQTAHLPGAIGAQSMAFSPDGKTLYLNGAFATVSVTDTASGRVLATIPLAQSQGAGALAVSPDGARLYVGDSFGSKLYVIDTATYTIVATPTIGAVSSQNFAMSPDGKFLYINNNISIDLFDTRSLTTTATFPLSEYDLVATPDNKSLLGISNVAGALSLDAIDAATGAITAAIPLVSKTGAGPIAVSNSGNRAYVGIGSSIAVVDLNTNKIVQSIPMKSYVASMAVTPDDTAIFALDDAELVGIDVPAGKVRFIAVPAGAALQIALSPDGASIFVLNDTDSAFSMVDLATQTQIALVPIDEGAGPAIITPDGTQTWVSGFTGTTGIFDNLTHRHLMNMVGSIGQPAPFQPNGELVYNVDYADQALTAISTKTHQVVRKSAPLPSFTGDRLAVSSDGRTVYVTLIAGYGPNRLLAYDAATLDYIAAVDASAVESLAQNPRLPYIYSLGYNAIGAIDTRTNRQTALMTTPSGTTLTFMAVTPDGSFGYASDELNLYGFDLVTNKPTGTIAVRATSLAFSPDGWTAYAILGNTVSVIDRATGGVTNMFTVGDSSSAGDSAGAIAVSSY